MSWILAHRVLALALVFLSLTLPVFAQSGGGFNLEWSSVDGGGGRITGGGFVLEGSIGQPDASDELTGGDFTLKGGFQAGGASGNTVTGQVALQFCAVPCQFHNLGLVTVNISGSSFNGATTTDSNGQWNLLNVPNGVYTVTAAAPGHLDAQLAGLQVNQPSVAVPGTTLLAGDVISNNFVNINDITAITPHFGQVAAGCFISGKPADFDCNNFININDITGAVGNFAQAGPQPW